MEVYDMEKIEKLRKQCLNMKLKSLEMSLNAGSFGAHIGGAFSVMEILAALYEVANIPDGEFPERDRVILSKGHGALALYTALWQKGFISEAELATYDTPATNFHGHPHKNSKYCIEMSTGSLGLGFSYAVGVALANKKNENHGKVFVIIGDGECDEGMIWESAMSAVHFGLNNLTVIVDANKYQLDGEIKEVMNNGSLADKFSSFGFDVKEVNGHDIETLLKVFASKSDKPTAIIAHTVKANGISFLENNKLSHQCSLTKKKYEQAVNEIKEAYGME